jgi:DeoR/GlpR family transcriptional regulator of sugar metabolism
MARKVGSVSPSARQKAIADHVMSVGTTTVQDLVERVGVSLVTLHRDLDALVQQGLVRKFHGGVSAQPSSVFESNVKYRLKTARQEKVAIAQAAASMVEPGMSVLLDDSTTTLAIAKQLRGVGGLTIITNFLPIMNDVIGRDDARLITWGGEYNTMHESFIGAPCAETARALRADIGFYSFAGVLDSGVYHQEPEIVFTKRALLGVTSRRILVADHTKLGRTALHHIAPLSDFERLISDDAAAPDSIDALRQYLDVTLAATSDKQS